MKTWKVCVWKKTACHFDIQISSCNFVLFLLNAVLQQRFGILFIYLLAVFYHLISSMKHFMQKPFKYRKELAQELGISTKTLKRRMDVLGIVWDKSALPFDLWQPLLLRLQSSEVSSSEITPEAGLKKT